MRFIVLWRVKLPDRFQKIAFIGLGLISGSMIHATRRAFPEVIINGYARTEATRARALDIGLVDQVFDLAQDAVVDADLIVLGTPVGVMAAVMQDIKNAIKPGAVITDVGSVKGSVIEAVAPLVPDHANFVPGHPIAGTENSGPDAGFAELFEGRWWILTPQATTDPSATDALEKLIQSFGAKTARMDADHHDLVLAVTSHVPHLIAYTMVGVADDLQRVTESEVIEFSAAGFRDFTRIAASDPTMWRDVFLTNKDATLDILARFKGELAMLEQAIISQQGEKLFDYFTHTRQIRRSILEVGQDVNLPDFGRVNKKE